MGKRSQIRKLVQVTPERNPVHFSRLIRSRMGAKPADIAAADGVSEEVVVQSIKSAQMYVEVHVLDFSNTRVIRTIIDVMPETGAAIKRGLNAKKVVVDGKRKRLVHDHATQLKAVGEVRGFVEAMQPKSKGTEVHVSASAQLASFSEATYQPGFEELIDEISSRVQQQNDLPREVGTTNDEVLLIADGELEGSADGTAPRHKKYRQ